MEQELVALRAEHDTLRAWLRANGGHRWDCLCSIMRESEAVCTCGWRRLREALRAEVPVRPALDEQMRAALATIADCAEKRHGEVEGEIPEGAAGRDVAFRACEIWGAALRFIAQHARAALAGAGIAQDEPPAVSS